MAINRSTDGMREVLGLVEVRALRSDDDQGLLRRFVENNDEAAFRVIAERHGPMVLGVCRRVLSCPYDAEDALQATFLVFARKAATTRSVTSLAGWLHGVATRVATTLRRERRRRRTREQASAPPAADEPRDELSWAEVKCGLDEELARLSPGYREVLVLCCLEGRTRDEAAQRLGVAVGVVKGRLERARKALADRLAKRGLILSAGLFAVAVSSEATAVSVRVSALISASPALSPTVLTLANSVLKGVTMSQLRLSATGLLAVIALVTGTALGLIQPAPAMTGGPKVEPPVREQIKAPVPKAAPSEGVIVVSKLSFRPPNAVLEVMDTAGKSLSYLAVGDLSNVQRARVSPDGKRLAFVRFIPLDANQKGKYEHPQDVYVVDLPIKEAPTEPTFKGVLDPHVAWAPDGNTLFVSSIPDDTDVTQAAVAGKVLPRKTVQYDASTKKDKQIELPKGHEVHDVSPDGKTLLTRIKVWGGGWGKKTAYLSFLVPLDTLKPKTLGDEDDGFEIARFSPDGTRVVSTRPGLSKSKEPGVFIADVATGKVEKVPLAKEVSEGVESGCVVWAPDGKRLAVMWLETGRQKPPQAFPDRIQRIMVVGADGKNEKVIREFGKDESPLHIDWADPKLDDPKKAEPTAKPPVKDSRLLFSFSGKRDDKEHHDSVVSVDPATGTWTVLAENGYRGRVSPDGGTVAFVKENAVHNAATDGSNNPGKLFEDDGYGGPVYSRDGKHLYVSRLIGKNGRWVHTTSRYTAAGDNPKVIPLPEGEAVLDVSPDGKTFLTRSRSIPALNTSALYAMEADGVNKVQLSPDGGFNEPARFSPDGKRVAFVRNSKGGYEVWVVGADGKNGAKVFGEKGNFIEAVCWSPDGERLAVIVADLGEGGLIPYGRANGNWRVELISADGKEKTTLPLKADEVRSLRGPDWYTPPAKADAPKAKPPAKEPKELPGEGLIWTHNHQTNSLIAYTSGGKEAKKVRLPDRVPFLGLTPDGTRMAFGGKKGKGDKAVEGLTLHVGDVSEKCEGTDTGLGYQRSDSFVWSPDGKRVVRVRSEATGINTGQYSHVQFDFATNKETKLDLPAEYQIRGWATDGKTWLVCQYNLGRDPKLPKLRWLSVPTDGGDPTPVCDGGSFQALDLSADGKAFVATGHFHPGDTPDTPLGLIVVSDGKADLRTSLEGAFSATPKWSPDGQRVACIRLERDTVGKGNRAIASSTLSVIDAKGKEEKLFNVPVEDGIPQLLGWFPTTPVAKEKK